MSEETDEEAWARIGARQSYRCIYCMCLVKQMRLAAEQCGAAGAMDILRAYDGMICGSIEWMKWPDEPDPFDALFS